MTAIPATATDVEDLKQAARRLSAHKLRDGFKPQALHRYTDEAGNVLYYRIRLKNPETGEKWIRPMMLSGSRYVLGEPDFPNGKPLYRLHELAARPHDPVVICEGETCADALLKLGVLATTSGGADSAGTADLKPLAGRDAPLTMWPDNDPAGARYGDAVAKRLQALGRDIRMLDVGALDLPHRGDAVDWLAAHPDATAADVLALPCIAQCDRMPNLPEVSHTIEWPEPEPLPADLLAVPQFPDDLLPESLRPWVIDIADRVQCAPEFVAIPAMVALGSLIGRRVGIRPQALTDWTETANLWGCIVGRPGCMKSPALNAALAPLERLAARARADHEEACKRTATARIEADLRASAMKDEAKRAYKKGAPADISALVESLDMADPPERRYASHDSSYQALAEILIENPSGILVIRDELVSLLSALDRDDSAEARGFYLTGWNGNAGYTVDRITRGRNRHVPAVCLSLIGGTQPGRLASYIRAANRGGAGDDGLIQRFGMLVWPDQGGEWRNVDRWPDTAAKHQAFAVFERMDNLNPLLIGAVQDEGFGGEPEGIPYLRFAPDALEVFTEWRADLEQTIRGDDLPPALESHFAKYRKLVPALALVSHVADGGVEGVSLKATLRAIAWAQYLDPHARRAYGSGPADTAKAARLILARVRSGAIPQPFAAREVYRKGWAGLSERETVTDALALLEDHGQIIIESIPTGGRFATVYTVNPRAIP